MAEMEEDKLYPVKFTGEALELFREAWPHLPPGDEIVLKMRARPCVHCGEMVKADEFGGIVPKGITEDGELVGDVICQSCMEKGL